MERFRAFRGKDSGFGFWWLVTVSFCRRVSGLGGEDFRLPKIWAFVARIWAFVGRDSGFRIDFSHLKLRAAL